jgi:hypothetical protein
MYRMQLTIRHSDQTITPTHMPAGMSHDASFHGKALPLFESPT